MSNWAMGWAQRQKVGCPVAKAVLGAMCYLMRDDSLLVYPGIPTLCEYTEYDDRTIRKAIARLAELGMLLDTGLKKNNVTVWRVPGYENWLRRQAEGPDNKGRASETDLRALAQVAELTKEKTSLSGGNVKPSQKGEGPSQAPPLLQPSPPISAPQAPPKMGGNLQDDLHRSSGARADAGEPYGPAPRAQETKPEASKGSPKAKLPPPPPVFDERASRQTWFNAVHSAIVGGAVAEQIAAFGTHRFADLPHYAREILKPVFDELVTDAIEAERAAFPHFDARRRKDVEASIEARVRRELKPMRPKSMAELSAAQVAA